VLKAWHFPDDVVDSLANHHEPPSRIKTALSRALVAGEALARVAMIESDDDDGRAELTAAIVAEEADALALARIEADVLGPLALQVRRGGELLAAALRTS
jgi:HD-like signal output (HDOD) protein